MTLTEFCPWWQWQVSQVPMYTAYLSSPVWTYCVNQCLRLKMGKSMYHEDTAVKTLPPPSAWQDGLAGEHEKWASQSLPTTLHKPNLVLLTGFSLKAKPQICVLCFHSRDRSHLFTHLQQSVGIFQTSPAGPFLLHNFPLVIKKWITFYSDS